MKTNKKTIILASLLPFQILFINYISNKTQFIETYYSEGIYPYISRCLRILFGWIPISVGDVLAILMLLIFGTQIFSLIKNNFQNFFQKSIQLLSFLSFVYCCFYLFWGLNYFRAPLAKKLQLESSSYTKEELINTTILFIDSLNSIHRRITENDTLIIQIPYSNKEIYDKVAEAFTNLNKSFPQLKYRNYAIKNSLISLLQSYNGTAGYLNPFTGEAQVNKMIPKAGMAATACHEVAHQIGWSAENEANFIGFLACIASDDHYFKYSGYRMALRYCMRELQKSDPEKQKILWRRVNKGIRNELRENYTFWRQYENPLEPYIKKGYSSYLKINKQSKGIASYSYVVDLLIAYTNKK